MTGRKSPQGEGSSSPEKGAGDASGSRVMARLRPVPDSAIDRAAACIPLTDLAAKVAKPIKAALDKIKKAFEELENEATPLLDRLFPEIKALIDFESDQNTLAAWAKAGKIDADKLNESLGRLRDTYYGTEGGAFTKDSGFIENISDSLPDLADITNKMAGRVKLSTDDIGESFESAAQRVSGAVSFMAQSIKGGGFIGILEGIAGLFSTLGSVGTFGSEIAGRINGKRARGGATTSNRTYLVGERGPELFTSNQSGYITPNNKMGNQGRATRIEVIPSEYFTVVVDGRAQRQVAIGAPGIATAAASGVQSNLRKSQARSLP